MTLRKRILRMLLSLTLISFATVSCSDSDTEDQFEDMGESIEDTSENAAESVEDGAEEAEDELEDMGN